MKYLNKNLGLTLIEIMIAVGLVSALSMAMMKLMQDTNKAVKTSRSAVNAIQLSARAIHLLSIPARCNATVAGIENDLRTSPAGRHNINSIRTNATTNSEIVTGAVVDELRIDRLSIGEGTIQAVGGGSIFEGFLTIDISRSLGTFSAAKPIKIHVVAEYDVSNNFLRCSAAQEAGGEVAQACSNLGGTYGPTGCLFPLGVLDGGGNPTMIQLLDGIKHQFCELDKVAVLSGKTPGPMCDPPLIVDDLTYLRDTQGNSTLTIPNNVVLGEIVVTAVGGGGAGRSGGGRFMGQPVEGGEGGSAGEILTNRKIYVRAGDVCNITVGAGGGRNAGTPFDGGEGNVGFSGGNTRIVCPGGTVQATGGSPGVNYVGGGIESGSRGDLGIPGFGGSRGQGGAGAGLNGTSGTMPGSGGGGGGATTCLMPIACDPLGVYGLGGNGAPGLVKIDYKILTQ